MATYKTINEYPVAFETAKLLRKARFKEKVAHYYFADGILREGNPPQASHNVAPLAFPAPTIEQAYMFMRNELRYFVGVDLSGRCTIKNRLAAYNSAIQFCLTKYLKEHDISR